MLNLRKPTIIDRVMIGEDLTFGQLIRAYTVEVHIKGIWVQFSNGTSIGHKKIDIASKGVLASALRLNVTASVSSVHIKRFSAFLPCAAALDSV